MPDLARMVARIIYTIGHSTRSIDEFIRLLRVHRIQQLIDVRTIPRSRHNPQFNMDALAKSLKKAKITYIHMPQLGGLRKARRDSINAGWKHAGFRGYADYMQTQEFWTALEKLTAQSPRTRRAIMCAEAVPWRCHRSLIADALTFKGWTVQHIISERKPDAHRLTTFAVIKDDRITYPAPNHDEAAPRLF